MAYNNVADRFSQVLDNIKLNINLVEYIQEYHNEDIKLKKTGNQYRGFCPFHKETKPSFTVSDEKGLYHCFGCGAAGDIIRFVERMEGLGFIEVVKMFASRLNLILFDKELEYRDNKYKKYEPLYKANQKALSFYIDKLYNKKLALQYLLVDRKLTEDTIRMFNLGYAPILDKDNFLEYIRKNKLGLLDNYQNAGIIGYNKQYNKYYNKFRGRVIIPIYDNCSRLVGFTGRIIDNIIDKAYERNLITNDTKEKALDMKYYNTFTNPIFDKSSVLFGINLASREIRRQNSIILCEGQFCVMRLFQNNIQNVVACGGTAFTDSQAHILSEKLNDFGKVYMAFDGDNAGIEATNKTSTKLTINDIGVFIISLPTGYDVDNFVREKGKEAFKELKRQSLSWLDWKIKYMQEKVDKYGELEYDKSINGKNKMLNELIEIVAQIEDEKSMSRKRQLYIGCIADKFKTDINILLKNLEDIRRHKYSNKSNNNKFHKYG